MLSHIFSKIPNFSNKLGLRSVSLEMNIVRTIIFTLLWDIIQLYIYISNTHDKSYCCWFHFNPRCFSMLLFLIHHASHLDHGRPRYGWFQWYCRFFEGRRTDDDARQIKRWLKVCGPSGGVKMVVPDWNFHGLRKNDVVNPIRS